MHQFLSDKPAGSGRCKGNKLKRYSGIPATLLCPFSKAPLSISRTAACRQSTAQNSFNFALETHLIYAIWRRIRSLKAPLSELRLASSGFTPHQVLFPVSAVMMRDRSRYDEILEGFSQSISPYIDYEMHQDGSLVVNIRLRTYIDSGTQPDSRSTYYMTAWLKPFAPISGMRSDS